MSKQWILAGFPCVVKQQGYFPYFALGFMTSHSIVEYKQIDPLCCFKVLSQHFMGHTFLRKPQVSTWSLHTGHKVSQPFNMLDSKNTSRPWEDGRKIQYRTFWPLKQPTSPSAPSVRVASFCHRQALLACLPCLLCATSTECAAVGDLGLEWQSEDDVFGGVQVKEKLPSN